MNCPICRQSLTKNKGVLVCTAGHGTLMSGKILGELKNHNLGDYPTTSKSVVNSQQGIICPNCSASMHKVDYNSTGILIDSCANCPYRWLDAGEIAKIETFKPKINPEDLNFLEELKQKTDELSTVTTEDPNPRLPLYSSGWGGLIRGNMAGNSRRTLGLLAFTGISGLVVGIKNSKLVRVVAPFFIIGFIILGYLIYQQVRQSDLRMFP